MTNILQCNVTNWSEHAGHLILTSDFDAALISETHLEEAKLTTAVDQARKSAWAGTGRTRISTAIKGTSAEVLALLDYFLASHILGVRNMVNVDFDSVVARQLIGPSTNAETMTWKHLDTVNFLAVLDQTIRHVVRKLDADVFSLEGSRPAETVKRPPRMYGSHWATLWRPGVTLLHNTGRLWNAKDDLS